MRSLRWITIILLAATLVAPLPALAQGGTTTTWFDRDVVVADGERIDGDLMAFGGRVQLLPGGTVDGNVMTIGSDTTIDGRVEEDVVALGGTVTVTAQAVIMGDLVVFGTLSRDKDALVRGSVVEGLEAAARFPSLSWGAAVPPEGAPSATDAPASPAEGEGLGATLLRDLSILVVTVLMAALVATLLPGALQRTSDVARNAWGMSLGIGVLTGILVVLLFVISALLVLICIGLPLLLVLCVALLLGALVGWTAAGQNVGRFLATILHLSRPPLLIETVLGTAAITLVAMIPVAGPIVAAALLCWGVGAAVLANTEALRDLPASPYHVTASPASPGTPAGSTGGERKGDTKPLDTSRWPFVPEDQDPGTPG